jgi:hypothetical protein
MPVIGVKLKDNFPKDRLKVDLISLVKGKYTYFNSKIVKDMLTPYKNFIDYENDSPPKSLGEIRKDKSTLTPTFTGTHDHFTTEGEEMIPKAIDTPTEIIKDDSAIDVEASGYKTKQKVIHEETEEIVEDLEKIIPEETKEPEVEETVQDIEVESKSVKRRKKIQNEKS